MKKRLWLKRTLWLMAVVCIGINIVAAVHAYKFTHFTKSCAAKTSMEQGFWSKVGLVFTGVDNPRPENSSVPLQPFESINIEGEIPVSCWFIAADSAIGTVVVCHGYGGCKSSMLDKADEFLAMGYSVLLPDFMGCGDAHGDQCTIGFYESAQVKSCCRYLAERGEQNVFLFGTSMGAVAIMKSLHEDSLCAVGAILECPFGSMYQTTCARFDMMGAPRFPMAGLLVFWGGVENAFGAFGHNPVEYAKDIHVPVLLLYGEKDPKVSRSEIDAIYANLGVPKNLVTFAEAGHENYLNGYLMPWRKAVLEFLAQNTAINTEIHGHIR